MLWGDPPAGRPGVQYALIDDEGRAISLAIDEGLARALGGPTALDQKRATVTGTWARVPGVDLPAGATPTLRVQTIELEAGWGAGAAGFAAAAAAAITGPQRWVTILCRFGDATSVTPHPKSWFETLMGSSSPGMDHYWREVSYEAINLTGSAVVGWYDLTQPRSYYVYDRTGDGQVSGPGDVDFQRAVNDCTAVADADVAFPDFSGINLLFNQNLDCCAYGGSWTLNRDGIMRSYRVTWMPPWGYENQDVMGHEMGHGFGLPHSSGPYTATYDSNWDVMSGGGICSPRDSEYGCVAVHAIAYHKDRLGWIPTSRKFVPSLGASETIALERLGEPGSAGAYLMAQVPIPGSPTEFYTVETRQFTGYDKQVPGQAVVLHRVNTLRSDRTARVVDVDGNGNPNDAGAMWTPGEVFTDAAAQLTVSVNSATATGYALTILYGIQTRVVSVSVAGSGSVTSEPPGIACPGDCSEAYPHGTAVTLAATPAPGWAFAGWGGSCSGTGSCTLALTADASVSATFLEIFTLTVSVSGNGAVTSDPPGIACPEDCAEPYVSGTSLSLTATPPAGWVFWRWTGDTTGIANPLTLSLRGSRAITGNFTQELALAKTSLRPAQMGFPYSDTVTATGGPDPKSWTIVGENQPPPGLRLVPSTGVLTGIPEATGSFTFTVRVTADIFQVERTYSLDVRAPSLALDGVLDHLLGIAPSLSQDELRYLDLLGNGNGRFDVGDFRAWLVATGQLAPAPAIAERAAHSAGGRRSAP